MDSIKEEESDLKNVFGRIKDRNFSGNTGLAISNSMYLFSTTLIGKIGSLILTIFLARILLPELFGLYSLALSTILIFVAFSDMGIGDTLVRFVSRELGKNNSRKAKAYSDYLIKVKITLMIAVSLILIVFSKFISNNYYHKPLSLALMAGGLYVFFGGIVVILQALLQSHNFFRPILYRETIFQLTRIIVIPILTLMALRRSLPDASVVAIIIAVLALSFIISSVLLYIFYKRKTFREVNYHKKLSLAEKKSTNRFLWINSATILSGIFFGYIDIVMLGYFVPSEFIGYYQGAFSFINASISLLTFSAALLPIFSRLKKKRADEILVKTTRAVSLIAGISFIGLIVLAEPIVLLIFGPEYLNSVNILRILSLLLLSIPITTIYATYFLSTGKPGIVSKAMIISTVMHIALNYVLISSLIKYGALYAVYGAAIATLISRFSYLFLLKMNKK